MEISWGSVGDQSYKIVSKNEGLNITIISKKLFKTGSMCEGHCEFWYKKQKQNIKNAKSKVVKNQTKTKTRNGGYRNVILLNENI
ncbi:hypothetical protein BpHYR1_024639 [Brachionus plicatilis]|uniref:Uncharacterized protein n=1 Tax=Brachionus plicatilis TaxID=10195 RepID=A0A3M7SGG1_BRAPC|nr:hypothetical protein BpHYR1_024639 [Brachionus plicatilis]